MRIWILSDLHLEYAALKAPLEPPQADVCVIAGDHCRNPAAGHIHSGRPIGKLRAYLGRVYSAADLRVVRRAMIVRIVRMLQQAYNKQMKRRDADSKLITPDAA